jgi:hypothetical protein
MRILKNSKNHVFLNWNGEYIGEYQIHLNKNKTNKRAKKHKTGAN